MEIDQEPLPQATEVATPDGSEVGRLTSDLKIVWAEA
jgi:hypothetical protein